jgi:hypothetical protein
MYVRTDGRVANLQQRQDSFNGVIDNRVSGSTQLRSRWIRSDIGPGHCQGRSQPRPTTPQHSSQAVTRCGKTEKHD